MYEVLCHIRICHMHICRTAHLTCLKCYGSTKCEDEKDFKIKCTSCCVVFHNKTCFQNHLFDKIFKGEKSNGGKITPCQYMFFCKTCYKITTRFIRVGKDKTAKHNCEKNFCFHCNKHLKRDHQCFIQQQTVLNRPYTFTISKLRQTKMVL